MLFIYIYIYVHALSNRKPLLKCDFCCCCNWCLHSFRFCIQNILEFKKNLFLPSCKEFRIHFKNSLISHYVPILKNFFQTNASFSNQIVLSSYVHTVSNRKPLCKCDFFVIVIDIHILFNFVIYILCLAICEKLYCCYMVLECMYASGRCERRRSELPRRQPRKRVLNNNNYPLCHPPLFIAKWVAGHLRI